LVQSFVPLENPELCVQLYPAPLQAQLPCVKICYCIREM